MGLFIWQLTRTLAGPAMPGKHALRGDGDSRLLYVETPKSPTRVGWTQSNLWPVSAAVGGKYVSPIGVPSVIIAAGTRHTQLPMMCMTDMFDCSNMHDTYSYDVYSDMHNDMHNDIYADMYNQCDNVPV